VVVFSFAHKLICKNFNLNSFFINLTGTTHGCLKPSWAPHINFISVIHKAIFFWIYISGTFKIKLSQNIFNPFKACYKPFIWWPNTPQKIKINIAQVAEIFINLGNFTKDFTNTEFTLQNISRFLPLSLTEAESCCYWSCLQYRDQEWKNITTEIWNVIIISINLAQGQWSTW